MGAARSRSPPPAAKCSAIQPAAAAAHKPTATASHTLGSGKGSVANPKDVYGRSVSRSLDALLHTST
eukprot:scaffold19667_cov13-Tisochrysis_lutea.AAC.1